MHRLHETLAEPDSVDDVLNNSISLVETFAQACSMQPPWARASGLNKSQKQSRKAISPRSPMVTALRCGTMVNAVVEKIVLTDLTPFALKCKLK